MTEVALALIRQGDRWFLQRRAPENPVLPGLWEFPGGKAESSESLQQTLRREVREELGIELTAAWALPVLEGSVRLHPFFVEGPGQPRTDLAWGWFTPQEMGKLPMPPANPELIRHLAGLP